MRILGIDPGFDRVGWAVIEKKGQNRALIACGIIQTDKKHAFVSRLMQIESDLDEIISQHQPKLAFIESLFFATNAKTAMNVAQARGVILLAVARHGMTIQEYTPLQVKSAVTGNGHADKKAVEKMVRLQIKDLPSKLIDDTLDAVAIALC